MSYSRIALVKVLICGVNFKRILRNISLLLLNHTCSKLTQQHLSRCWRQCCFAYFTHIMVGSSSVLLVQSQQKNVRATLDIKRCSNVIFITLNRYLPIGLWFYLLSWKQVCILTYSFRYQFQSGINYEHTISLFETILTK